MFKIIVSKQVVFPWRPNFQIGYWPIISLLFLVRILIIFNFFNNFWISFFSLTHKRCYGGVVSKKKRKMFGEVSKKYILKQHFEICQFQNDIIFCLKPSQLHQFQQFFQNLIKKYFHRFSENQTMIFLKKNAARPPEHRWRTSLLRGKPLNPRLKKINFGPKIFEISIKICKIVPISTIFQNCINYFID